ncbi:hypothetical protein [Butyrivibrio sp. WCD2001]|uniref:hypothetical protein n=1 Tax=Butyrivibrio sp. WCD2001 TaxID=1280681 RepID=UPI00041875DF|nr:hypothetical protein [Butyrivibrio sp. WCD2001]
MSKNFVDSVLDLSNKYSMGDINTIDRDTSMEILEKAAERAGEVEKGYKKLEDAKKEYELELNERPNNYYYFVFPFYIGYFLFSIWILDNVWKNFITLVLAIAIIFCGWKFIVRRYAHKTIEWAKEKHQNNNLDPRHRQMELAYLDIYNNQLDKKLEWGVHLFGNESFNYSVLYELRYLIKSGRADTIKEALNLFDSNRYQQNIQDSVNEMQNHIKAATELAAIDAEKKRELLESIEKNTNSIKNAQFISTYLSFLNYIHSDK